MAVRPILSVLRILSLTDRHGRIIFSIAQTSRGVHAEQWCHAAGCRRWFNVREIR